MKLLWGAIFIIALSARVDGQVRTLEEYIQSGISSSPYLHDLSNRMRSNSVDSQLIISSQKPLVNFTGDLYYAPRIDGWGYSEAITNGGNFITTLNVSQPLFNNKTRDVKLAGAGLMNQSLANTIRLSVNELKYNITNIYLDAWSTECLISSDKEVLERMKQQDTILRELVDRGYYRQSDYLSFLVETGNLELELTDLQVQFDKQVANLNLVCGTGETNVKEIARPVILPAGPVSPAISPQFRRFVIDSLVIVNEKEQIGRRYKPLLSWRTDAGIVNNVPSDIYKNVGISIGINLYLPVYDGGQRKLEYAKLGFGEETRRDYSAVFKRQYSQHLKQLGDEASAVGALVPKLENQLKLALSVISQNKALLNNGIISVTDFLISIRNYINIKNNLNQAEIRIMRITNELNYWSE